MVAVRFSRAGRPRLQVYGHQRKQQRQKIGQVVAGFGEQRQRVRLDSGNDQQGNVGQGDEQGNFQHLGGTRTAPGMHVHVHLLQCIGAAEVLQGTAGRIV